MPTITIDAIHDADTRRFTVTVHAPHQSVLSSHFHYAPDSSADVIDARRRALFLVRSMITLYMDVPRLVINNDL